MYESISYEESLKLSGSKIYVDVRSPSEFKEFTIPNSINIPILNDEERKIVGTLYDSNKYDESKIYGIDAVSKRLPKIFRRYISLNNQYKNIIIFCARGGYRSSAVASFLKALGLRVYKISGGYKRYRKFVMDTIKEEIPKINFITLYGNTGTGKTKIINRIKEKGYDTIDLEMCANHKGSYLGMIGMGEPNSQKMFESLLVESLINRKTDKIIIEGESKKIGKVVIPDILFEKILSSEKIGINSKIDFRILNIKEDYIADNDEELKDSIRKLKRYISNEKVEKYNKLIDNKDYDSVIKDLCVNYYDPMYESRIRNFIKIYENFDNDKTAEKIIKDFLL